MANQNKFSTETVTRTVQINLRGVPYIVVNSRVFRSTDQVDKLSAGDKVNVTPITKTEVKVHREGSERGRTLKFTYAGVVAERRQWTRPRRLDEVG